MHESVVFIDDTLLFGQNYDQCKENVIATVTALETLGFVIHPTKSVLQPVQKICFLGFVLDSENMTVTLLGDKITKVALACQNFLDISSPKQTVCEVIGLLVSALPGVCYGKLYLQHLQFDKNKALKTKAIIMPACNYRRKHRMIFIGG